MNRPDAERLKDILAAIDRCLAYREFLDTVDFGSMAYDAVLRNLAVIGEAVRSLPAAFRHGRPEIPWASIIGLRNVVVHEHFRVNPDLIREILDDQLTSLAELVRHELGQTR